MDVSWHRRRELHFSKNLLNPSCCSALAIFLFAISSFQLTHLFEHSANMFARYIALSTFESSVQLDRSQHGIFDIFHSHTRAGEHFATPKPGLSPLSFFYTHFSLGLFAIFFLLKCSTASGTANCNAVIQIRALTPSRRLTVDSRGTLNSRSMFARRRRSI